MTLDCFESEVRVCHQCKLRGEYEPVVGVGPVSASLLVVGEFPSSDEALLGRPMEDRGGLLLRRYLKAAGFEPGHIRITLAVRCPTKTAATAETGLRTCKNWLAVEFQMVRPKAVITLGGLAARAILPLKKSEKMTSVIGTLIEDPRLIIAPWHGLNRFANGGVEFERKTVEFFSAVREKVCSRI